MNIQVKDFRVETSCGKVFHVSGVSVEQTGGEKIVWRADGSSIRFDQSASVTEVA